MKRFRLATWVTLVGVSLAAGCASPCGGCGRTSFFQRLSMFRSRSVCGCDSCGGGGPVTGVLAGSVPGAGHGVLTGAGPGISEGPILGEPPGPMIQQDPSMPSIIQQDPSVPAPTLPPSLGAPSGSPGLQTMPERFQPIPTPAPTAPANPSSRSLRSRT